MSSEIRKAASVIAGRDTADGLEVLVLERAASSRFLPGYVAFPGGAIDEGDVGLAERWFYDPAQARRAGVVRELVEECGLAVTAEGIVESGSLDAVHAAPPRAEQLAEIAHWIAPEDVPVRFDARFYAVAAPLGPEPTPDGVETEAAWWAAPGPLLEAWEAQRRKLFWPTYLTMRALAECGSTDELLALRIQTREPDDQELEWLHRSTFYQD